MLNYTFEFVKVSLSILVTEGAYSEHNRSNLKNLFNFLKLFKLKIHNFLNI